LSLSNSRLIAVLIKAAAESSQTSKFWSSIYHVSPTLRKSAMSTTWSIACDTDQPRPKCGSSLCSVSASADIRLMILRIPQSNGPLENRFAMAQRWEPIGVVQRLMAGDGVTSVSSLGLLNTGMFQQKPPITSTRFLILCLAAETPPASPKANALSTTAKKALRIYNAL